jgi:hypothetical protein
MVSYILIYFYTFILLKKVWQKYGKKNNPTVSYLDTLQFKTMVLDKLSDKLNPSDNYEEKHLKNNNI